MAQKLQKKRKSESRIVWGTWWIYKLQVKHANIWPATDKEEAANNPTAEEEAADADTTAEGGETGDATAAAESAKTGGSNGKPT